MSEYYSARRQASEADKDEVRERPRLTNKDKEEA